MLNSALAKLNLNVVRSLSAVSLHKAAQIVGMALTVVLVPRLFGAEDYGRFSFVLSLAFIGQILGDFGTLDVMGKFVPGMPPAEAARLYGRHLAFKIPVGLVCGAVTTGAALLLAGWMRLDWALLVGLSVFLHIAGWVPYHFALGLNRVGVWMTEQAWRQWAMLVLLLALLPLLGLTGALLALLLMEVIFLLLGLWAVRGYWRAAEFRLDLPYLAPYLRFGAGFFLANLTAVALYRSGPLLVESLTGQPAQTGYFNLALGLFLLVYVTTGQFAQSLIPALSDFYRRGEGDSLRRWLNNFVRWGWLLGWLAVILVWAAARWAVPLVFGRDFGPAEAAFRVISLGLPLAALLWAGNVTATASGRGRAKFGASLAGLVLFGAASAGLIPGWGAAGAAASLVLAVAANTGVLLLILRRDFAPRRIELLGVGLAGVLALAVIVGLG